jgi:tryptophan-rich sensory protein
MNPELAFIEILLLLGSILYYSKLFYAIYPLTAWMQVPYITWVTFATLLNGSIAWLN